MTISRPTPAGRINPKHIDIVEYDAILSRIRELGRSEETVVKVASEFNRGVNTIRRLAPRVC